MEKGTRYPSMSELANHVWLSTTKAIIMPLAMST